MMSAALPPANTRFLVVVSMGSLLVMGVAVPSVVGWWREIESRCQRVMASNMVGGFHHVPHKIAVDSLPARQ
jgi:hypothetical protein